MKQSDESWEKHPTYSNYLISTKGRVIGPSGKLLKGSVHHYPRVTITHEGKQYYRNIHVLMAETYLGRTDEVVRHLDDVKTNNNIKNLALGTHQDNSNDAIRNGKQGLKTYCKRGHLREGGNLTNDLACRACVIAKAQAHRDGTEVDTDYANQLEAELLSGTWSSKGPRDMSKEGKSRMLRKTDVYHLESHG